RAATYERLEIADRIVVEELDTEKIALDRSLGRLWRIWRKRVRSPDHSVSTPSHDHSHRRNQFRTVPAWTWKNSLATEETQRTEDTKRADVERNSNSALAAEMSEYEMALAVPLPSSPSVFDLAVNLPLPMNKNDVNEIEIQ